jgi:hypothetical protein
VQEVATPTARPAVTHPRSYIKIIDAKLRFNCRIWGGLEMGRYLYFLLSK